MLIEMESTMAPAHSTQTAALPKDGAAAPPWPAMTASSLSGADQRGSCSFSWYRMILPEPVRGISTVTCTDCGTL